MGCILFSDLLPVPVDSWRPAGLGGFLFGFDQGVDRFLPGAFGQSVVGGREKRLGHLQAEGGLAHGLVLRQHEFRERSIAGLAGNEYVGAVSTSSSQFWQSRRGLIWSNPEAGDAAHIRAALLRPRFGQLLDIALEFGLERVHDEWAVLEREGTAEAERARRSVERILSHIEEGFARAAT
jgi:hypothetical protein